MVHTKCMCVILALLMLAVMATSSYGQTERLTKQYAQFRQDHPCQHEQEFQTLRAQWQDRAAMEAYLQDLQQLDALVVEILVQLKKHASAGMGNLMDLDGAAPAAPQPEPNLAYAEYLYNTHVSQLVGREAWGVATPDQLAALNQYRGERYGIAIQWLGKQFKFPGFLKPALQAEITRLLLVLPFLQAPDAQWTSKTAASLPEKLLPAEKLHYAREFACILARPMTALSFHEVVEKKDLDPSAQCTFLLENAEVLKNLQKHRAAIRFVKQALEIAHKGRLGDRAFEICFDQAELYQDMGYPDMAAAALGAELGISKNSSLWGKGVLLYLKYLYNAGQFDQVASVAPKYLQDSRCSPWRSQITYILWVAKRNLGLTAEAETLRKDFLETYPDSPLCADMYFAAAMEHLAQGDYERASELLEIVEFKYPDSSVAAKAKGIQERLKASAK